MTDDERATLARQARNARALLGANRKAVTLHEPSLIEDAEGVPAGVEVTDHPGVLMLDPATIAELEATVAQADALGLNDEGTAA